MFNRALIIFLLVFQAEALADARPVIYNITMDYNSVANQFENIKATGSSTIQVSTSGYWPIEIRMQKDGVTGLTASEAGGGNHQIALKRAYTDFNFNLVHRVEDGLSIPIRGYLDTSEVYYRFRNWFENTSNNNNCERIFSNFNMFQIRGVNGSGCNGKTLDYIPEDKNMRISNSLMFFGFDIMDQIKSKLSQPNYKAGDYIGSVTYTGDSVFSRVDGKMSESYTFNFVITKKKQLTGFNFPDGTVSNFTVDKYGNKYVGTSQLFFNVDGVFNASDKLRFTFSSANSRRGRFNLKHSTDDKFIPYNIELVDLKVGRPILVATQNETKSMSNSSENILNGKFNFNFSVSSDDIVTGDYSDRLTIIVALDI
ncbi:hypothetical protein [Plesiomonas shigelloides]|uniref:hypothetical protein n=1 Tax=Plesiomonas shigelloides TaxID=703 RepID=UPI00057AF6C3|nr:hypothetical protein [Plesiomonas shigelloides]